jgi:protein TonB
MKNILTALTVTLSVSLSHAQTAQSDSTATDTNKVYTFVDKTAEFRGGMEKFYQFIGKTLNYPVDARRKGIQGRVFVKFVIEPDGKITNVETVKGVYPSLNAEAERVIRESPKWIPAELQGRKVRQAYTLPMVFKLR